MSAFEELLIKFKTDLEKQYGYENGGLIKIGLHPEFYQQVIHEFMTRDAAFNPRYTRWGIIDLCEPKVFGIYIVPRNPKKDEF